MHVLVCVHVHVCDVWTCVHSCVCYMCMRVCVCEHSSLRYTLQLETLLLLLGRSLGRAEQPWRVPGLGFLPASAMPRPPAGCLCLLLAGRKDQLNALGEREV